MDRKEAYAQIKKLGLEEDVKKKFGKNFTQVSTEQLIETCKDFSKPAKQPLEIDEDCLKKVGKKAAQKAYRKANVPAGTLLAALERQKRSDQWSRDGGRYIPNPATWLNQGRWEDEIDDPAPADPDGEEELGWL